MNDDEMPESDPRIRFPSVIRRLTEPKVLQDRLISAYEEVRVLRQQLKKKRVYRFVNTPEISKEKLMKETTAPRVLFPDEVTLDRVRVLALVHATDSMFAGVLEVSPNTWKNFLRDFPEVQQVIDKANAEFKKSLRVKTVDMAMEGNWNALKHLNEQILGEHAKSSQEVNVNVRRSILDMTDDILELPGETVIPKISSDPGEDSTD